jgi:hypothetical protein
VWQDVVFPYTFAGRGFSSDAPMSRGEIIPNSNFEESINCERNRTERNVGLYYRFTIAMHQILIVWYQPMQELESVRFLA